VRLNELSLVGFLNKGAVQLTPQWQQEHPVGAYFLADTGETVFSVANYIVGSPHDGESPWYFWPTMQSPILFYSPPASAGTSAVPSAGDIVFTGNLLLWLASTLAVFAAIAVSFRHVREHYKEKADHRTFFILFTGYVFAMLPFILFIHRSTFLYHYFPALIFAFGLLAWLIGHGLNLKDWSDLSRHDIFMLSMIVLVVVIGFLATAPFTYGL
jgi:dolichyl-phosphate-mannose-protein mannosyltransferase